ncbi:IgGFc-binding protein-like [Lissotriton helveticus]
MGDKAGKLLAWLDRRDRRDRWIAQLTVEGDVPIRDPGAIVQALATHYETVYASASTISEDEAYTYIKDLKMPVLTEEETRALDVDLTTEEIRLAIKALQTGKALGPNGIPVDLYKQQAETLAPHLLHMFKDSLETGRSFIVAFMQNYVTPANLILELSSYDEPCMVQITVPSPPYNQTVLLAKNSTTEVVLPSNYMLTEGERSRKLVTVSSDADISVIAFNIGEYTADAFACLSKQVLGKEYFVFTATSASTYGSHFAVGNGENVETQVNITVSGSLLVNGTRYEDKQMVTITLAPQEVILLSDANDLTGTRVASSTPVAVFSGSKCYFIPSSGCDTLIEQLYPVQSWGQQFVVFPLMTKGVRDRIFIIAARPNTTVTLRDKSTTLQYSLQPGSEVSMDLETGMLVNATEPIMVGYLFQGGYSSLPFIFDPFIATVPPSNFSRRYYKFVTNAFFNNSLFIVSRSSNSSSDFLLDNRPLSEYVSTVRGLEAFTGWEVNLGKIGGQHEISHQSETFEIYVYGVESYISYGYSLGQAESFSGIEQLYFYICHLNKNSDAV